MKKTLAIVAIFVFVSVGNAQEIKSFTAPSGKKFTITRDAMGAEDVFKGTDRAAAKTSIPKEACEKSCSLEIFIQGLLSKYPDSYMLQKGIPRESTSNRVKEESRIVTVQAFMAASKKEADNDFHVILCTDPSKFPIQYFTAEVSGIPRHSEYADDLIIPRQKFKDFFKDNLPDDRYDQYEPPIPVQITGALFFDVDHKAGVVGPKGKRPNTAWEIHPVTDIEFR